MEWTTEASAQTSATPERVWGLWSDVEGWSRWDPHVVQASLDGAFSLGSSGLIRPKGGPNLRFTLVEVTINRSFIDRCRLPLATIDFIHELTPTSSGTMITHRVVMSGPLTFVFRRLIGSGIERGLPAAVRSLAECAQGSAAP